jgi:hypothetical protein
LIIHVVSNEKPAATKAATTDPTDPAISVICAADKEETMEWIFWASIGFAMGASLGSALFVMGWMWSHR